VPEKESLMWKIKSFPGGREFLLRAKFSLPSVAAEEEQQGRMPPIRVNFEIPYFTVSGIQVCKYQLSPFHCDGMSAARLPEQQWHRRDCSLFSGEVPQGDREKWLPSTPLGPIHHNCRGV
jgi:hypothetical protein